MPAEMARRQAASAASKDAKRRRVPANIADHAAPPARSRSRDRPGRRAPVTYADLHASGPVGWRVCCTRPAWGAVTAVAMMLPQPAGVPRGGVGMSAVRALLHPGQHPPDLRGGRLRHRRLPGTGALHRRIDGRAGGATFSTTTAGVDVRVAVGGEVDGWHPYEEHSLRCPRATPRPPRTVPRCSTRPAPQADRRGSADRCRTDGNGSWAQSVLECALLRGVTE